MKQKLEPGVPIAASDLYLACACAAGAPGAHKAFEEAFVSRLPGFLSRIERDAAVIDEVVQRVRDRVLVGDPPRVAEYRGRGSLAAWLRVIALRLHADLMSERGRGLPLDDEEESPRFHALAVGADLAAAKAQHRQEVERALSEALRDLPARERTMLRLHYVDGLSLAKIGELYRVDKATVSRWLRAARERLADDAFARLGEATGMSADEAKSLSSASWPAPSI
jgi:RNA polymerase sigma-70 factor (ECF subfamily)